MWMPVRQPGAAKGTDNEIVAKGLIGHECFEILMHDSNFDMVPLVMETPVACFDIVCTVDKDCLQAL